MVILKKGIHFISNILFVFVFLCALVCLPVLFGIKPLVVLSGSMEPTFHTGSVIYYKKVKENNLKVGDIITFEVDNHVFVSHRIFSIVDGFYKTKGDANNSPDDKKISFQNIKGKDYSFCIPYIGFILDYMKYHFYLVVAIAGIFVLDNFIKDDVSS